MTAKEKICGFLIFVLGFFPFLLKVKVINNALGKYTFLQPGQYVYQIILILIGLFLIIETRRKVEMRR